MALFGGFLLVASVVGIIVFPILGLVSLVKKNGKAKRNFKLMGGSFAVMVLSIILIGATSDDTETISTSEKPAKQEKVKKETPEQIAAREAKEKAEAEAKAKAEAKAEAKAKAKAEEEAKKEAENLVAVVHLDDVKDLPKYTIETYKNGDEVPAANGSTMNCTYPTCYRVTFDVNGSGQNPTAEYNSLITKLEDRSILDNSYDGPELATIKADYWTKDGMITSRFYK
ncbi:hypothetical protein [Bacillus sp. 7884-1]|uniref:hypothetical protein n=1 Tax=Bacillus sp. 7884-1 TaxID=2021693 RepID=UPI000BCA4696|nr:hypothetical protein [Bacillus sp. 7884-1]PAE31261.1 hypothetical protein CHI06_28850 [Bacillus sp. 7884-1]